MEEILNLVNEMSPYLLLGFLLAGLMHAFIPGVVYSRYLSGHNFRSIVYAALLGIPLPLCSCGVIPTSMSLRREGASKGATVSFLVATPETGIDSIIATYSLLGLPFAIIRPFAALCNAMLAGVMVNTFDKGAETAKSSDTVIQINETDEHKSVFQKVKEAIAYGYGEMMEDIGKWLVIGLIIAGLITVFVPDSLFATFKDNSMMSMLLVLCIAIPMYICATGSIPIAVALMAKGLTPGAALVLLMAGPACNMASILVINKVLGKKTLIIYLLSILICALFWGTMIDNVLPTEWFREAVMQNICCHEKETSWFNWGCTILLCLLLLRALWHHYHHPHCHCGCGHDHGHEHHHHEDSCSCHGDDCECETNQQNTEKMKEFNIKGMNCNHCAANALKVLKSLEGVEDATVDLASTKATVKGNVTNEAIAEALDSIGFTAVF